MGLNARQNDLLGFIRRHVQTKGYAPTFKECRKEFGLCVNSLYSALDTLVAEGCIERFQYRSRGIQLLQTHDYHVADCDCVECARARYLRDLQIVQALQVGPPVEIARKLVGLRSLSNARRIEWLGLQRKSSPRQSAPKLSPAVGR